MKIGIFAWIGVIGAIGSIAVGLIYHTIHKVNYENSHKFYSLFCDAKTNKTKILEDSGRKRVPFLWMAPILNGGGYGSEAKAFALSTKKYISISHFADSVDADLFNSLPEHLHFLYPKVAQTNYRMALMNITPDITVCHSEPGAWYPPLYDTFQCPPSLL